MRLSFFEELSDILFLMAFLLVSQPNPANGFLGFFDVQAVFPNGRIFF
jgi:hypothetical protein